MHMPSIRIGFCVAAMPKPPPVCVPSTRQRTATFVSLDKAILNRDANIGKGTVEFPEDGFKAFGPLNRISLRVVDAISHGGRRQHLVDGTHITLAPDAVEPTVDEIGAVLVGHG